VLMQQPQPSITGMGEPGYSEMKTLRQFAKEEVSNAVNATGIVSFVALQSAVQDEVLLRLSEQKQESHDVRDLVDLMVERMEAAEGRLFRLQQGYDRHFAVLEARTDLREEYVQFTDGVKSQMSRFDEGGAYHGKHQQEAYEQRLSRLMEEISERDTEIQTLHEKLQTAVVDGFKAVEKQFRDLVTRKVTTLSKELKAEIEGLKKSIPSDTESRFEEALTEHADSLHKRMEETQAHSDKKHKELQVSMERLHREFQMPISARDTVVDKRFNEEQTARLSLGKECGVKLHAITYALLDVIEEVELTGTAAEARDKRARLHHDLCARLGGAAAAVDRPAATEGRSPTPATAARSSTKDGKVTSGQDSTKLPSLMPRR